MYISRNLNEDIIFCNLVAWNDLRLIFFIRSPLIEFLPLSADDQGLKSIGSLCPFPASPALAASSSTVGYTTVTTTLIVQPSFMKRELESLSSSDDSLQTQDVAYLALSSGTRIDCVASARVFFLLHPSDVWLYGHRVWLFYFRPCCCTVRGFDFSDDRAGRSSMHHAWWAGVHPFGLNSSLPVRWKNRSSDTLSGTGTWFGFMHSRANHEKQTSYRSWGVGCLWGAPLDVLHIRLFMQWPSFPPMLSSLSKVLIAVILPEGNIPQPVGWDSKLLYQW